MLVLSRRIGEEIIIGNDIHVTILSIKGKQTRIGITAPGEVPVLRLELLPERPPALHQETPGEPEDNR